MVESSYRSVVGFLVLSYAIIVVGVITICQKIARNGIVGIVGNIMIVTITQQKISLKKD